MIEVIFLLNCWKQLKSVGRWLVAGLDGRLIGGPAGYSWLADRLDQAVAGEGLEAV